MHRQASLIHQKIIAALLGLQALCSASVATNPLELVTHVKPVQRTIIEYLTDEWHQKHTFDVPDGHVDIEISPDGEHAVLSKNGEHYCSDSFIRIVNLKDGSVIHTIDFDESFGPGFFVNKGKQIAVRESKKEQITLFDVKTGAIAQRISTRKQKFGSKAIAYLSDNSVIFGSGLLAHRYDFTQNQVIKEYNKNCERSYFSPDGKYLVSPKFDVLQLWDENDKPIRNIYHHELYSTFYTQKFDCYGDRIDFSAAFSSNSKYLACKYSVQNDNLSLFATPPLIIDLSTDTIIATLDSKLEGRICSFSTCGNYLAIASYQRGNREKQTEKSIKAYLAIWNIYTKKIVQKINHANSQVNQVFFSQNGDYMLTSWREGTVRVYSNIKKELESLM